MPKTPKAERKSPIVGEERPRPPLKLKSSVMVKGVGDGGVDRKTGKICMNALL